MTATDDHCLDLARQMARHLDLPFCPPSQDPCLQAYDFALQLGPDRLELRKLNDPQLKGAVYADFSLRSQKYGRRRKKTASGSHGGHELLYRAIAGRKEPPAVLDLTAGLGRDSFVLAARGCRVCMVERSPILAALIRDGLLRARSIPAVQPIVDRLCLVEGDGRTYLEQLQGKKQDFDVIYLDPMFPQERKKSKSKKQLQMLQQLIGPDNEGHLLLQAARQATCRRIVVKRARKSPFLDNLEPSHQYCGRSTRYDVYLDCQIVVQKSGPQNQ